MQRFLKWLGISAGVLMALVVCAVLYLFVASQRVVARTYARTHDGALGSFHAPGDSESIRKGKRLAAIYGCSECHGPDLSGTDMFDEPGIAHITAPNLTAVVKDYTDAEFERLLRHGIKHDGTSTWIMPSSMFHHLSDEDLGAITAYVRSFPQTKGVDRLVSIRHLGRVGIVTGQFTPQAAQIGALPKISAPSASDPLSQGRYLVMTACTECHGARLEGGSYVKAPNLAIAAAYSDADFDRLMRHGKGLGDRDLGLMSQVAKARFSHFTDAEVNAIHGYLRAFAQQGALDLP